MGHGSYEVNGGASYSSYVGTAAADTDIAYTYDNGTYKILNNEGLWEDYKNNHNYSWSYDWIDSDRHEILREIALEMIMELYNENEERAKRFLETEIETKLESKRIKKPKDWIDPELFKI